MGVYVYADDIVFPVYKRFSGNLRLVIPSAILGGIAFLVTLPIYVFYWKGPAIRERSKFAQTLASDRQIAKQRRVVRESEKQGSSVV